MNSGCMTFLRCAILISFVGQKVVVTRDDFWFTVQPKTNIPVVSGQSVILQCDVSSRRHITFYWTLRGEEVKNTTRRRQQDSDLLITRVDPAKDSGDFNCIATNASTGLSLTSLAYSLNVQWLRDGAKIETVGGHLQQDEIETGSELTLRCDVDGSPEIALQWFKNGAEILKDSRMSFEDKRIRIRNVSLNDGGMYSCSATNGAGSVDSIVKLPVIVQSEIAAKIKKYPVDRIAKEYANVTFDCVFDNADLIEWYFGDDGPLTNSSRRVLNVNGSLSIRGVHGADEGTYGCVGIRRISAKESTSQTFAAHLTIAYLDRFPKDVFAPRPSDGDQFVITENAAFEVECKSPHGHPRPTVRWENPHGKVISNAGRVRVEDGHLIIDGAKKIDIGKYVCVAENIVGSRHKAVQIEVTVAPKITLHPSSMPMIDEDETTILHCGHDSSPYPLTKVTWLKDGKYIRDFGGHYVVNKRNGSLVIRDVSIGDKGSYQCEVTTEGFVPVRSRSTAILIKEKLKFAPPPIDKKFELGSKSRIYCKARGSSPPVVRWVKEGEILFSWPRHVVERNGTLYFNRVLAKDAGKYMCIATNSQGFINTTIRIDVLVFPKFLVRPVNTSAYEGDSIMLHCKAYSEPEPTIQWDKNNRMNGYDQRRGKVLKNGTLLIEDARMEDAGNYGCMAGNMGGLKREEVTLTVKPKCKSPSSCQKEEGFMTMTVIITLSAAAAYMFLVIGLMIWCKIRRSKKKAVWLAQANNEEKAEETGPLNNRSTNQNGKGNDEAPSTGSHNSKRSRYSYDRLHVSRQDLQLQNAIVLGSGEYGEVFLTRADGIADGRNQATVMVKSLQSRDEIIHFSFKKEIDMFYRLNHGNVARLLGVCKDSEPALFVLEYSDLGDLKQFLLASRKDGQCRGHSSFARPQLIAVCNQIATGMEHLASHNYVHGDLAARNCLISSDLNVKVTMQGLSHDTYRKEYIGYKNRLIPARWLAPEAFSDQEFSTRSDVWSYAVVVWEILNGGRLPFAEHSDEAVVELLEQRRLTWQPPDRVDASLSEILLQCWSDTAKYRPTFSELIIQIGDIDAES